MTFPLHLLLLGSLFKENSADQGTCNFKLINDRIWVRFESDLSPIWVRFENLILASIFMERKFINVSISGMDHAAWSNVNVSSNYQKHDLIFSRSNGYLWWEKLFNPSIIWCNSLIYRSIKILTLIKELFEAEIFVKPENSDPWPIAKNRFYDKNLWINSWSIQIVVMQKYFRFKALIKVF